jgi:hypothetical protein
LDLIATQQTIIDDLNKENTVLRDTVGDFFVLMKIF